MPAPDERELIDRAREGSGDAFRRLVERHMRGAYDIAYHFLDDHDDAEDVAQDAFIRAHAALRTFRGEAEFGTWLYRIVANLSMNRLRSRKSRARREVRGGAELENLPAADAAGGAPDLPGHLANALGRLPSLQRKVVTLRHLNGFSTREVSSILNCSEGTVKTHLHRGLRKMRVLLAPFAKEGL